MKKYGILFVVFAASLLLVASTVPALSASPASFFDIFANDDTFVRVNNSSNWDNQGLFIKEATERDLYLEFTLGNQAVTDAKLKVYQSNATCDGQLVKWKGYEWSFDETTLTWNNQANASGWDVLPTFQTLVNTVGWYEIDITSFYNTHLGKTVSFFAWARNQTTDQFGNMFEDREGKRGTGNVPRISGNTVPEPSSLLALATGLFGLAGVAIRKRR